MTRKTVKQVDTEQDLTEDALRELFHMIHFMNSNPHWTVDDYMQQPGLKDGALAKLLGGREE